MALAAVIIICLTIIAVTLIICIFTNSEDVFDIHRRMKDIEETLTELSDRIIQASVKLDNIPNECDVKISENFPKMTYQFEIHFTDLRLRDKEGRIKRIAEEVERHLHDEV